MAEQKKKSKSKSKYNDQIVASICKTLAETGSDSAAYGSVNLGKSTYYRWLKEKDDFKLKVHTARAEFLSSNSKVFRDLALSHLFLNLRDGTKEIKVVTVKEKNANNRLETVKETMTETIKGPAQWAIDRALGMPIAEMDALKVLMEAGWIEEEAIAEIANRGTIFNKEVQEVLQSYIVPKVNGKNK